MKFKKILVLQKRKIEGKKNAYISLDVGLFPKILSRDKYYRITIEEIVD